MSQVGGDVGGKIGGSTSVDQTQFPFFTSPGGVTPQQQSLAEYDFGQNLTEGQAQFEGSGQGGGPSLSTMATQTAGGANTGQALDLARMSDVNQGAALGAFDNAINISQQNNTNALAENQTAVQSLGQLAGQAQSLAGTSAGLSTPTGGGSSTDVGSLFSGGIQ
jgi:hypothetical protein